MMEWTSENNKETINGLLDFYADLLAGYRNFVDQNLDAEFAIKLKALQELKSVATTIELLLKRWSFVYRGYDGNAHQAREDANAMVTERASLTDKETEGDFDGGDDSELVELRIILRKLPEMAENGHPIDREPLTPIPEAVLQSKTHVKKMKKETVAAEISKVLDAGEQTTAAIADAIGRSERSVRRDLKALISESKVSVVKKGVYRLHRSVKWTEADNRYLINQLLRVYTQMIDLCKGGVKDGFTLEDVSDTEQIKSVKTFNACVATVDRLMKRWSLVHLGWNTNPQLAKADAEANAFESERVDLQNAPIEAFFIVTAHYHRDMKELLFNLPGQGKKQTPPNYEVGLWSYDATTQELYPPDSTEPISEADARKILLNRKSSDPAPLAVFGDAW